MDTPSSTVPSSTASNTNLLTNSNRSALIDISNDSPIVGLETGSLKTPSSGISKMKTLGSGESILRGQVKNLLQKVEEEAEITKNADITYTLQTPCLFNQESFEYVCFNDSVVQENVKISQEGSDVMISRSLLSELSGKLGGGKSENSSSVSTEEDDNSSVWSIQVNASSRDEKEEEEEEEEIEEGEVDELCEVMKKMNVVGKHTRFVYDSEDELVKEEQVEDEEEEGILKLKGLPTPQGKHVRFPLEDEEDE
ncbi:uncharacterized protein LOC124916609 [Impatiens glandulifera]|uniref:uncharacterized protein LOC124916609 n=1 Tax=Impatiens glandulifera TaxID=253017 RepID=UPI001FB0F976|nr:uncharacterized protein LOC124916609 [Impatiens glandulifera]